MSLHRRFLLSALVLVLVVTPVIGYLLVHSARVAITESFDARLESILNVAIASLDEDELGELTWEDRLGDSRFRQLSSGWYWQIDDENEILFRSESLYDRALELESKQRAGLEILEGPSEQRLRVMYRTVRRVDHDYPIRVVVAGNQQEIEDSLDYFEWLALGSFLLFAVLLFLLLALQTQWALRPLRRLQRRVARLQANENIPPDMHLPSELRALAKAIHKAIDRNEKLLENSRLTAGNLAHALKTPLAVLQSYAEQAAHNTNEAISSDEWRAEITRMNEAIHHHLARASAAGRHSSREQTLVFETLAPVLRGLQVIAVRQNVNLETIISSQQTTHLDAQDLQEIVGNLVENALLHAQSKVVVTFSNNEFLVCDDGDGIPEAQREKLLQRGQRLDQRGEGYGLGLAIVMDILQSYDLTLEIVPNHPRGTCARVRFV